MKNGSQFIYENNGNGIPQSQKKNSMNNQSSYQSFGLLDPEELISLIQRHLWLILFCVIVFTSGTYYVVNYQLEPIYESEGTILVSSDDGSLPGAAGNNMGSGFGKIIAQNFTSNYDDPVQSAIYLFESREISRDIAQRLMEISKSESRHPYPTLWEEYPEDSTRISIENLIVRIRNGLVVEAVEPTSNRMASNLLAVSFESYSPYEAAKVVNIALSAYQEKTLEQKQSTADKALAFLEQKKSEIQEKLNQAEDRLVRFQNETKLVAVDQQAGNSVNTLSQLKVEKQNLQIELESVNSSIQNFERQMEAIKPGMSEEYTKALGPTITKYQNRLAELRTQKFVILTNNPELKDNQNSEPELKKLNKQIDEIEQEIRRLSDGLVSEGEDGTMQITGDGNVAQELATIQRNLIELRIQKNQIESQLQVLNQRIAETESFLDTFPDNQAKLARLETEVQRYKQLHENLVAQESEVALWQQTQNSTGTVIDEARPLMAPVKPNKILWLCFALMLGLVVPIGSLIVKKSLNTILNSYDKLKSYPYPLLPVIYDHSLLKSKGSFFNKRGDSSRISQSVVFFHNVESPLAEAYRKIVNQLLYSNPDEEINSLLTTSSGQGEGKTTFTANLGAAFAEVDKKVLIIDCDFRRPAIHKLFSLDNSIGVKEVLFDDRKLSEAIKKTGIPDLEVLTSGAKPVSPAKLLASDKFKEMVRIIKPNYDIVLFDTPPQSLVSDVSALINLTDVVIVTARFGQTHEKALKHTLEELEVNNHGSAINLALTCYKPSKSYDTLDTKGMHKYMYNKYYEYEKG